MQIVVIGSGFGGLSAAIRLRAQGHEVTVFEKLGAPGGRAAVFQRDGFTFDAGPTIITAPWLIDELFALGSRRRSDFVALVPLDPCYQVRFEDGTVFRYHADRERLREEVRRLSPADVHGFDRFTRAAARIFDAGMALIDRPFTGVGSTIRMVPQLVRLRADRSVAAMVSKHLRDERLRRVFSFHPLLIGGNPFRASSIYALIHVLEQRGGVWFVRGGTGALVRALVDLFEAIGGRIEYESEVVEIVVPPHTRRASGVRLRSGALRRADVVVSNADAAWTYLNLVPRTARSVWTDSRLARARYSMSLFVLYFGTTRRYPDLAHHEILMGVRYRELLEDIFERKILAPDFSLYLHRPTATDPALAPAGHDAWYALAPVPHLGGRTDWESVGARYRDAVVEHLERRCLPGLSRYIVSESRVDPRYFRDVLNSHLGSAFSLEPVLLQSAWFRPHNVSEDVSNLFLCGAGTHPGAGIPGVISSGKIVADLIGR